MGVDLVTLERWIAEDAKPHMGKDSTGQTFLLVDNHTGRVVSTRGSREAALILGRLLKDAHPEYKDAEFEVMPNPYGGSE